MSAVRRLWAPISAAALVWVAAIAPSIPSPPPKGPPVRGLIRPLDQAAVATDLAARIAAVRFREGEAFRKGDVLIVFDCERQEAELAAASAQHREMKLALESATYLDQKGAVGRFEVEVARARTDKAAADVAALSARIKLCQISAPFDGRVAELSIHAHEIPTPGKPLIALIDETALEIELIVPSHWLRSIAVGAAFKFSVDELDATFSGKLTRIGAAVDPVSQTVKIIGVFDVKPAKVLPGMSGSAVFEGQPS
jgi:membrane fusion protein, multidrug efflux system